MSVVFAQGFEFGLVVGLLLALAALATGYIARRIYGMLRRP